MKRTNRKFLVLIWRMLREGAGLSQQELADKLHLDRKVISRIENGTQQCSYQLGVQIVKACGGKGFISLAISQLQSLQDSLSNDRPLFA